jgi:hypothetical protein
MAFLLVIIVLVLFITWLLVAPLVITLDSNKLFAEINWRSIGRVQLLKEKDNWILTFSIFSYRSEKCIETLWKKTPAKKKGKESRRKTKSVKHLRKWMKMVIYVMQTFRIIRCTINLDTQDAALNSWMHISYGSPLIRRYVNINYNNQNDLYIQVKNRPGRMLYTFLSSYFLN